MLQKESWLFISDNTNVRWIKIFHLYKGFHRKTTKEGYFIKASSRVVEPPRIEYKGFKYKYYIKGNIVRSIIIRTVLPSVRKDKSFIRFYENSSIIIKKKQDPKSKFLLGPISRMLKRKRMINLFHTNL